MAIVLRSVKGSNLTAAEVDGNFTTLEAMVGAKAAQGVGIASVALVSNNVMQFQMTDHSYLAPVTLPTATFRFVGVWQPYTAYLVNDIFGEGPSGYIVLVQHTSAATFDPHATDGAAHNLYGLYFTSATPVPAGGTDDAVLTKHSSADFDLVWSLPTLAGLTDVAPTPPLTGEVVYWNGSAFSYKTVVSTPPSLAGLSDVLHSPAPTDGQYVYWHAASSAFTYTKPLLQTLGDVSLFYANVGDILQITALSPSVTFATTCREPYTQQTSGSAYTLTLSDLWSLIDVTIGSAFTITIPPQSSVAWPSATIAASKIRVRQSNITPVTIVGGAGVGVSPTGGRLAQTRSSGSIIELERTATDNWIISGDTAFNPAAKNGIIGSGNIDLLQNDGGDVYPVTPSANITLTMSNPIYGKRVSIAITTSGTTPYTIAFSTGFATTLPFTTGIISGATFTLNFICDGTLLCETSRQLSPPTPTTIGGVKSFAAVANQFLTQIGADGGVTAAQPSFANLSGGASPLQVRQTTVTTLAATGTVSLNPALGDVFKITPTGAVTLNAASAPAGARITLIVVTSGTTPFNITPTTNFKSTGALATGAVSGAYFTISFVGDGTNLIETSRTVAM